MYQNKYQYINYKVIQIPKQEVILSSVIISLMQMSFTVKYPSWFYIFKYFQSHYNTLYTQFY